jgi:hypothetical protein
MIEFILSEWVPSYWREHRSIFRFASLDNWAHVPPAEGIICNPRTIVSARKTPMLSENLEWFDIGFFYQFKTEIFIHFKALTILPIFKLNSESQFNTF